LKTKITNSFVLYLADYIERRFPALLPQQARTKLNPTGSRTSARLEEIVHSYNQTVPPKRRLK
jgi:HD superfamily phosphohydrolase YqeK